MADKPTTVTGGLIGLVLVAILGVTYLPRQGTESAPATETKQSAATKESGGAPKSSQETGTFSECREIFSYLKRFYSDGEYYPESCFPQTGAEKLAQKAPSNHAQLHFIIAILPNPVQTHLPLEFDRAVEAIMQAAQDEGYTYDGSWFPWDDTVTGRDSLDDATMAKDLEEKEHRQPGVLVFRRGLSLPGEQEQPYSGGLIVFLVGEQPTGGIDAIQFEHAVQWMSTLQTSPDAKTLRILGPTFTGSLTSLARQLKVETIQPYTDGVQILSGSVTSDGGVGEFKEFLALRGKEANMPGVLQFQTFSEGDAVTTNRFLCYLWHGGYDLSRVAVLSEDQTAFGRQSWVKRFPPGGESDDSRLQCGDHPVPEYESVIKLYYPRDIASLRSAYEKQSIFSAGKQAQTNAPSTMLRGDLSESPGSEHDTVRSYAGQLTPLDQEAVLFGITNILDNKHVEFVIVRSSNSLDQVFLSEFLRRSYPGVRVVIAGSDLLLRRGMTGASLRGVMLLSTYPLLGWTQDAAPVFRDEQSGSYRVFGQDVSEGLYIAARQLILPPGESFRIPISDYAPPMWATRAKTPTANKEFAEEQRKDEKRPATWVLVVGHRQFWPVAVLNSITEPEPPANKSLLEPNDNESEFKPHGKRQAQLPGEMVGLLALLMMLGVWHVYCCRKGSIIGSPRVRAYFAPIPRIQHPVLIFLGSLIVGFLGVLLAFVLRSSLRLLAPISSVPAFLTGGALVVFGFLGCLANYRLPVLSPDILKGGSIQVVKWQRWALRIWLPLLVALAFLFYHFVFSHLNASNLFPTFWRNVFLRNGVSGLLPQVLLLLGLYGWFWSTLQGLSLLGADRPVLPSKDQLPEFDVPPKSASDGKVEPAHRIKAFRMFSRENAGEPIEAAALPLSYTYLKSLAVLGLVTVLGSYLALGEFGLRSLGDRHFGELIFLGACLCIAMILADALQFLRIWSLLRQLLNYLDRLRLRRTLDALKGLSWDSVWKMSGNVLEQRYRLISRQFESMRNLTNLLDAWKPSDQKEIDAKDAALAQLNTCATKGAWFADWYVKLCDPNDHSPPADITPLKEFQEELAATAASVMELIIFPAWNKETQSLLITDQKSGSGGGGNEPPLQAAEEFFVLPYLGFIQNTIGRIRSIAISMLALFVAATLAVSSYPFDPLPVIGAIFLITFALVGTTTVFVYAEMHRDATLSRITNKRPGELGFDFWAKLVTFGLGPLIGLLTTLFPSMTDFIVSFLQPGIQAIK